MYLSSAVLSSLGEGLWRLKERWKGSAEDRLRVPCKVVWGTMRDIIRI